MVLERVWGRASRSTGVSCGQKVDFNPFLEFFAGYETSFTPQDSLKNPSYGYPDHETSLNWVSRKLSRVASKRSQHVQIYLVGVIDQDTLDAVGLRLSLVVGIIGQHLLQAALITKPRFDHVCIALNIVKVRPDIALA